MSPGDCLCPDVEVEVDLTTTPLLLTAARAVALLRRSGHSAEAAILDAELTECWTQDAVLSTLALYVRIV